MAQPVDVDRLARAQALFSRGVELVEQGSLEEGCAKFEAAQRLAPDRLAIRLRLADCRARQGDVLLAWALFIDTSREAAASNQPDLAKLARDLAADLEGRLPRIRIDVPDSVSQLPGVTVRRNGALLDSAEWGVAIPVRQGAHTVWVGADDKTPWLIKIEAKIDAPAVVVSVPELVDHPVSVLLLAAERLEEGGKKAAGCDKRREAWALPERTLIAGVGYGRCLLELGHLASATHVLRAVSKAAHATGDATRAAEVRKLADEAVASRPLVSVRVALSLQQAPGLEVRLDGELLLPAQRGGWSPVEPGPHTVTAKAHCRAPFSRTYTLARQQTWVQTLDEETLTDACPTPTWAKLAGGAGAALAATSLVFAVEALGVQNDIDDHCEGRADCRWNGDFDRSFGLSVASGVGALGALGAALYGVASSSPSAPPIQTATRSLQIQILPLGATVRGAF